MRAEVVGNRLRIYFDDGRLFYTFYDVSKIAQDLVNSELTMLERIVYKEAFRTAIPAELLFYAHRASIRGVFPL